MVPCPRFIGRLPMGRNRRLAAPGSVQSDRRGCGTQECGLPFAAGRRRDHRHDAGPDRLRQGRPGIDDGRQVRVGKQATRKGQVGAGRRFVTSACVFRGLRASGQRSVTGFRDRRFQPLSHLSGSGPSLRAAARLTTRGGLGGATIAGTFASLTSLASHYILMSGPATNGGTTALRHRVAGAMLPRFAPPKSARPRRS
jgi:hypothetical protein